MTKAYLLIWCGWTVSSARPVQRPKARSSHDKILLRWAWWSNGHANTSWYDNDNSAHMVTPVCRAAMERNFVTPEGWRRVSENCRVASDVTHPAHQNEMPLLQEVAWMIDGQQHQCFNIADHWHKLPLLVTLALVAYQRRQAHQWHRQRRKPATFSPFILFLLQKVARTNRCKILLLKTVLFIDWQLLTRSLHQLFCSQPCLGLPPFVGRCCWTNFPDFRWLAWV